MSGAPSSLPSFPGAVLELPETAGTWPGGSGPHLASRSSSGLDFQDQSGLSSKPRTDSVTDSLSPPGLGQLSLAEVA